MPELSTAANNVTWLGANFVDRVPGVSEAVVVSSDGLPMALSGGLDRDAADRFAAVASGLIGLAYGAAGRFDLLDCACAGLGNCDVDSAGDRSLSEKLVVAHLCEIDRVGLGHLFNFADID